MEGIEDSDAVRRGLLFKVAWSRCKYDVGGGVLFFTVGRSVRAP